MATTPPGPPAHRSVAATGNHHARSITAAARRIDLTSKTDRGSIPRSAEKWQADAWAYFDLVFAVKFGGRFVGNSLSRIALYPGLRLPGEDDVVPLREVFDHQMRLIADAVRDNVPVDSLTLPAPGLTEAMVVDAEEQMEALSNRRTGQAGLMRGWGTCLSIAGDSWLVGTNDPVTQEEEWVVLSDQNLARKGDRVQIRMAPGARPEDLDEAATLIRVWRPHDAWPALADSNMRAVLDQCDELLQIARQYRSIAKSRNNAGLLLLPSELDFAGGMPDPAANGSAPPDDLTPFEREIVKSLVTPIEDDGSASAVVPHLIRGAAQYLAEVRHVDLNRSTDAGLAARAIALINQVAIGIDLPPEVMTGLSDANHWTGWLIQDSTYQAHIQPVASLPAWALTTAYLRPMLRAGGAGWDTDTGKALLKRVEVGLDPSALVQRPNRGQDTKDAHGAIIISDAASRKYLGFSEADAPSDEERLARYALQRGIGGQDITRELLRLLLGADIRDVPEATEATDPALAPTVPSDGPDQPAPAAPDQPIPDDTDGPDEAQSASAVLAGMAARLLTAAPSTVQRLAMVAAGQGNIGPRLAAIDSRLRTQLQVAASAAVDDAVRVAANRVKSRAKDIPTSRAVVHAHGTPAPPAPAWPAALYAAGLLTDADEDAALDGAFAALAVQWDAWVTQAQDDTEAVLRSAAQGDDTATDHAMEEYRRDQDEDRRGGLALLTVALTTVARDRMRGLPDTPDPDGESDPALSVQAGPVRRAMSRAGGSIEPDRPPTQVAGRLQPGSAGGVATGPNALTTVTRVGLATVAWEWHVGAPSRPFPPHSRLSGQTFAAWDDPVLAYSGWPHMGHAFPGDHAGCQCDAVPVVIPATNKALVL